MFSYNTIINFTELYEQEPNSTSGLFQHRMWAMESLSARSVQIFVLMKIYM